MQGQVQNYATLTKQVKPQLEKKPVSNLKRMESEGFEQISMKCIEIFVSQEHFLCRKQNCTGLQLSGCH